MPVRRPSKTVLTGMAVILALGASGCSGADDKKDDAAKSAKPQKSVAPVDSSKVSPKTLPNVPAIKKAKGAIADAKLGKCPMKPGPRQVKGTIKNSTGGTTDYLIVVSWINGESDVLSRGVQTVKALPAGESRPVTVKAKVAKGATQCTFLVQRGSLS